MVPTVVPGRDKDANPEPRDSGFVLRTPRNDGREMPVYFFKYFAKNAKLRGQAISALALS